MSRSLLYLGDLSSSKVAWSLIEWKATVSILRQLGMDGQYTLTTEMRQLLIPLDLLGHFFRYCCGKLNVHPTPSSYNSSPHAPAGWQRKGFGEIVGYIFQNPTAILHVLKQRNFFLVIWFPEVQPVNYQSWENWKVPWIHVAGRACINAQTCSDYLLPATPCFTKNTTIDCIQMEQQKDIERHHSQFLVRFTHLLETFVLVAAFSPLGQISGSGPIPELWT